MQLQLHAELVSNPLGTPPTFGLYSALRACKAMLFSSSLQSRLTVATMFCSAGTMPEGWIVRSMTATCPAVLGPASVMAALAIKAMLD